MQSRRHPPERRSRAVSRAAIDCLRRPRASHRRELDLAGFGRRFLCRKQHGRQFLVVEARSFNATLATAVAGRIITRMATIPHRPTRRPPPITRPRRTTSPGAVGTHTAGAITPASHGAPTLVHREGGNLELSSQEVAEPARADSHGRALSRSHSATASAFE
jgi:hypothetical protein